MIFQVMATFALVTLALPDLVIIVHPVIVLRQEQAQEKSSVALPRT